MAVKNKPIWRMTRAEFHEGMSPLELRISLMKPIRDPKSRYSIIKQAIIDGKPVPKKVASEFIGLGELLDERKSKRVRIEAHTRAFPKSPRQRDFDRA